MYPHILYRSNIIAEFIGIAKEVYLHIYDYVQSSVASDILEFLYSLILEVAWTTDSRLLPDNSVSQSAHLRHRSCSSNFADKTNVEAKPG